MAIRPNDGETFLREVDEELRKERLNTIVARWGWAIVAAVVLVLAAIGGYIWWQGRQQAQAAAQGESLLEALDTIESGNRNAAAPKIEALAGSDVEGYRAAGLFARATAQSEAGNNAAAVATLRSIADDSGLAEPYRQAALIRQTTLEFDRLQPQAVISRLGPLARPGQAWFGSAGELVAIAHLRMRRPDLAGPLFARIGRDETVPPSIRTRAIQMAGSLGINAMPDAPAPDGAPAEGQPDPGAAREKSE
ncbi:MAG TPA: tetratricopeptide repeat protein [Allosphingosinicella sp.]|nr:tetratricopeptide repeat protein [Allosphingosinicella sp.]